MTGSFYEDVCVFLACIFVMWYACRGVECVLEVAAWLIDKIRQPTNT